jgi:Ricin-type beta-trefoil lectin domain
MRRPGLRRLSAAVGAAVTTLAVAGLVLPVAASAASAAAATTTPGATSLAATGVRPAGATWSPTSARAAVSSAAATPGYSPASLRSAYNLTKAAVTGGAGATVAIVSAYGDPRAAADLAVYRSHYKLPACTVANGCLRIRNENGGTGTLPAGNSAWASTLSTEMDAVSALCPECHLLLVEAASNSLTDLGIAENTAVADGARFVVNGWGNQESLDENEYAHYFNHPGSAIVFAAGGNGYGSTFPAALQYVTSVGGTTLTPSSFNARGWSEVGWAGTGSGCSFLEAKPSWQRADANAATGCMNRTENDVSADANPSTGASVYDSYGSGAGWTKAGGTALAAAIVTAAYALAGTPAPRSYPASYPYQHAGHLYDVQFGPGNGNCDPYGGQYLCVPGPGYDGPTGLGAPDGTGAFSAAGTGPVTVADPGTQDREAGTTVAIGLTGLDSRAGATTSLAYTASGLPVGLSIKPVAKTTDAEITGKLPPSARSYAVTVIARDAKTGKTGTTRFSIVAAGSLTPAKPVTAIISTSLVVTQVTGCLDSGADTAGTKVILQDCTGVAEQLWTYLPEGAPGAPDELTAGGLCLGLVSGGLQLQTCNHANATQSWRQLLGGVLENTGTGSCLTTASGQANPLSMTKCDTASGYQRWWLSAVSYTSGVPGMCLADDDDGFHTSAYMMEPCRDGYSQDYWINVDGSVSSSLGRCLGPGASGNCDGKPDQVWLYGPDGELINESTGLCLDDPDGAATAGTDLTMSDCYGELGEIWGVS